MDSLWKRIWLAGLADHVLNLTLDTAFFFLLSRQVEVPEARKAARSSAQNFLHLPQGKERQQKLNARATWTLYPPAWASLGRTFRRLASVESTMVVQVDNTTELELALPAQQNFPEEGLVFELAIIKDHRVSFTQASLGRTVLLARVGQTSKPPPKHLLHAHLQAPFPPKGQVQVDGRALQPLPLRRARSPRLCEGLDMAG